MDAGVGSFIFSHALTSPHARASSSPASSSTASSSVHVCSALWAVLRGVLPLLVLGGARLVAIKGSDYQEHVTEYGVHWNFFFTLAAVALLSALIAPLTISPPARMPEARQLSRKTPVSLALPPGVLGVAIVAGLKKRSPLLPSLSRVEESDVFCVALRCSGYQYALSVGELEQWIAHAPRTSLLTANKEGVTSAVGYFALYLIGVQIGRTVHRPHRSLHDWWLRAGRLLIVAVVVGVMAAAAHIYIQPISRKMVGFWSE
jgi:phosphatidylinositol glycan class W